MIARSLVVALLLANSSLASAADLEVDRIELKRDDGTSVKYFVTSDRTQHVMVSLKKLKVLPGKATAVFTALQTEAGINVKVAETTGNWLAGNEYDGKVKLPRDFPAGRYKFELSVGGTKVAALEYFVLAKPDDVAIKASGLFGRRRAREDARPAAKHQALRPPPVDQGLDNGVAPGSTVTWTWTAVKTAGGSNVRIAQSSLPITELGAYVFEPDLELPRDFPVGAYRLELSVDQKHRGAVDFEIK